MLTKLLVRARNHLSEELGMGSEDRALQLLRDRGAQKTAHAAGSNLLEHLQRTQSLLVTWNVDRNIVLAGLFHSVYSTEAFSTALFTANERPLVQATIGSKAEALVYAFSLLDRKRYFESLPQRLSRCHPEPLPCRGNQAWLDPEVLDRDLLTLLLANELSHNGRAPAKHVGWLSRWSAIQGLIDSSSNVAGVRWPFFTNSSISPRIEAQIATNYHSALKAIEEPDRALALMQECRFQFAGVPDFDLWSAYFNLKLGFLKEADVSVRAADKIYAGTGVFWDANLDELVKVVERHNDQLMKPSSLVASLSHLERRIDVHYRLLPGTYRDQQEEEELTPCPMTSDEARRFSCFVSQGFANKSATYPELSQRAIWESVDELFVSSLEKSFQAIKNEVMTLGEDLYARESERIARTGSWDVVFFSERGRLHADNLVRCPTILKLMTNPRINTSSFGLVYVSRLRAGTRIAPHRGPNNLRLRCHLGLDIPNGDCCLRVDDRSLVWQEGRALIFNDALIHEAWNLTERDRTVLVIDLWHPDLTQSEIRLLYALDKGVQRHAESLSKYREVNASAGTAKRKNYD